MGNVLCFRSEDDGAARYTVQTSVKQTVGPVKASKDSDELLTGGNIRQCPKDSEDGPRKTSPNASYSPPPSELIQNILDPENGPAKGLPYQVHYLGPPVPPCETERMATIKALGRIDGGEDAEIANILNLVANIFRSPAALCALFDHKRVYISDEQGGVIPRGSFPWRWTLCGWSLAYNNPQILVIPDTHKDARFSNNEKVVGFPGVRFYCGAPLVASNGHRLGTLCFADVQPREFDMASCMIMNNMAELVVRQLEKDITIKMNEKANEELAATYSHLQRTMDCFEQCVVLLKMDAGRPQIVYTNAAWTQVTGLSREEVVGAGLEEVLEAPGVALDGALATAMQGSKRHQVKGARVRGGMGYSTFTLNFRPAYKDMLDDDAVPIGIPSFLQPRLHKDKAQAGIATGFYFMTVNRPHSTAMSVRSSRFGRDSFSVESLQVPALDGLELGHLLGKGNFGRVYYGTWLGTPVAIKIIEQDVRTMVTTGGLAFEAVILAVGSTAPKGSLHDSAVSHLNRKSAGTGQFDGGWKMGAGRASTAPGAGKASSLRSSLDITPASSPMVHQQTATPPQSFVDDGSNRWAVITTCSSDSADPSQLGVIDVNDSIPSDLHLLLPVMEDDGHDGHDGDGAEAPPRRSGTCSEYGTSTAVCKSLRQASGTTQAEQNETWMVMEFCDRGCLQDAIDRGWLRQKCTCLEHSVNMDALLATAIEIASALSFLHNQDVIHGDLSGWNVLLSSSGDRAACGGRGWVAKVADLGLARSMELNSKILTRTYGTLTHMPPETLCSGVVHKATDVYSFGVLLWQCFTGSRPWSGLSHGQIILMVGMEHKQLVWPDATPDGFKELACECMHVDAANRPTFTSILGRLRDMACD